jgi:hypothetical protein
MKEKTGLPEASIHITVVTRAPNGRRQGYFTTGELELDSRRVALLKRLVGEEKWRRSRGFKDVSWADVEANVAETFSQSRKPRPRKPTEPATRRKARPSPQD